MVQQLLFRELNEITFESVTRYFSNAHIVRVRDLVERNGWSMTTPGRFA